MRYRVIEAKDVEGLEQDVNEHIAEGWQPLGGVAVVNSQANTYAWWFYQAMVRPDGGPEDRAEDA
jgi:Domain of unknown function (DUF1737)